MCILVTYIWNMKLSAERMRICKSCEHLTKAGTCGTPILGEEITQQNGDKVYLCGCVMKLKTKLIDAECPLNKWKI